MKKFYITTPIYYVNDAPHIGHAYTSIAADIIARFKKMDNFDVLFVTGTDEHGQKVEKSAIAAGKTPQEFVDMNSEKFTKLMHRMNVDHDIFIRTTQESHVLAAQALWKKLEENGDIYLGKYSGWYAIRDEAFYDESEIIDGKAPTGAPVEWVEEPSYFFRLSKYEEPLLEYFKENTDAIGPEGRRNEVLSFIKGGLKDLSVSRTTFSWGIPVPGDEKHIMYVWLDALTNYITAAGYPGNMRFWPASLHLVGKDILRFHCVYWPAFLMSAGIPLPERIFAHGWWTIEGEKMSKSLGNAVDPIALSEEFKVDAIRFFLAREVSFGNDGDFSREALKRRINSDLANAWGNLVHRVLSFAEKNLDNPSALIFSFNEEDREFTDLSKDLLPKLREHIDQQMLHRYLDTIFDVIYAANRYVDVQKPWELKKTDTARMVTVLTALMIVIRNIAICLRPVMPVSSNEVLAHLCATPDFSFERLKDPLGNPAFLDKNLVGLIPITPLFQRVE